VILNYEVVDGLVSVDFAWYFEIRVDISVFGQNCKLIDITLHVDNTRKWFFTAIASEERGNVIARVCMPVRMSICVSPKCATNINSPRR
jgi:hypothetical protein